MDLFDIYQPHNLQDPEINKDIKEVHLLFRTYELLDFIKKFLRQIENAITQMGSKFIQKYCIEKLRDQSKTSPSKNKKSFESKNELTQIKCYKKYTAVEAAKIFQEKHEEKALYTSPLTSQGNMYDTRMMEPEEDCNLSDNEEEKT